MSSVSSADAFQVAMLSRPSAIEWSRARCRVLCAHGRGDFAASSLASSDAWTAPRVVVAAVHQAQLAPPARTPPAGVRQLAAPHPRPRCAAAAAARDVGGQAHVHLLEHELGIRRGVRRSQPPRGPGRRRCRPPLIARARPCGTSRTSSACPAGPGSAGAAPRRPAGLQVVAPSRRACQVDAGAEVLAGAAEHTIGPPRRVIPGPLAQLVPVSALSEWPVGTVQPQPATRPRR